MTPPPPPAATAAAPAPVPGPGAAGITRPRASLWADRAFAAITFLAVRGRHRGGRLPDRQDRRARPARSGPPSASGASSPGPSGSPRRSSGPPRSAPLPFIYGTLMTSAIAMVIAVPAGDRRRAGHHRPPPARASAARWRRSSTCWPPCRRSSTASGASSCSCPPHARCSSGSPSTRRRSILGAPFAGPVTSGSFLLAGLVLVVMVLPIIAAITREVLDDGAARAAGGRLRARRHPLGDGALRDAALGPLGHRRRVGARPRARGRRDDRDRRPARATRR